MRPIFCVTSWFGRENLSFILFRTLLEAAPEFFGRNSRTWSGLGSKQNMTRHRPKKGMQRKIDHRKEEYEEICERKKN